MTFITQLAGLADHIPVGLRLNVIMDSDEDEEWGLITAKLQVQTKGKNVQKCTLHSMCDQNDSSWPIRL